MTDGGERSFSLRMVFTVLLGCFTFILGMTLGALSLMSQSVQEVTPQTEDEDLEPGRVYYRKGSEAAGRWRMKRNELVRGNVARLRFSEDDLNDWSRHHFSDAALPRSATPPAEPASEEEGEEESFLNRLRELERKASPPNFAFVDGQLQISTYIEVPEALGNRRFLYQAIGGFELQEDGRVHFVPARGTIGQAPLVSLPFVGERLHEEIADYFQIFPEWEEIAAHWNKVASAGVEEDALVLSLNRSAGE